MCELLSKNKILWLQQPNTIFSTFVIEDSALKLSTLQWAINSSLRNPVTIRKIDPDILE